MYKPGDTVWIKAFEEFPRHRFKVFYVWEDCVGGYSIEGPLKDEYGEPDFELIDGVAVG